MEVEVRAEHVGHLKGADLWASIASTGCGSLLLVAGRILEISNYSDLIDLFKDHYIRNFYPSIQILFRSCSSAEILELTGGGLLLSAALIAAAGLAIRFNELTREVSI